MTEIINRVAQSNLVTIDLEEWYPPGKRILFDIKDWLYEGLVLRELDFREAAKNHYWDAYQDAYVALSCSTEAIIPAWAYLLLAAYLTPFCKKVVVGNLEQLEASVYQDVLAQIDVSPWQGKPVILKGCSRKPVPASAYVWMLQKLQPVAKSIMYGEACSAVPVFKKK